MIGFDTFKNGHSQLIYFSAGALHIGRLMSREHLKRNALFSIDKTRLNTARDTLLMTLIFSRAVKLL